MQNVHVIACVTAGFVTQDLVGKLHVVHRDQRFRLSCDLMMQAIMKWSEPKRSNYN